MAIKIIVSYDGTENDTERQQQEYPNEAKRDHDAEPARQQAVVDRSANAAPRHRLAPRRLFA